MPLKIDIRHDLRRLELALGAHAKETLAAGVRAINRTLTSVRAQAARAMRKEYPGLKVGAIKARLKIRRAKAGEPLGWLEFSGKRFALYGRFGMRARGRWGARFSRLPWRVETVSGVPVDAQMLQRAFRQRGAHGRPNVFARKTAERLSHEVLVAPGLARAFTERHIGEVLVRIGRERFRVVFEQELKFRISKRAAA